MSQRILPPVAPPAEPPAIQIKGSPLTAAAESVQLKMNEQTMAVQNLGGKMTGGGDVTVKNIPQVPSAGNSNPAGVFAGMQELKATALEQGKYDKLGNDSPMMVGGRKRKTRKHKKNGRKVHRFSRKHRRAAGRHSSVRHSRRGIRSHRGKKTHTK